MSKIIQFPGVSTSNSPQQVAESVVAGLRHDDPLVLKLWRKELSKFIEKYPGTPEPSKPKLKFEKTNITKEEASSIMEFIEGYKADCMQQIREMTIDHGLVLEQLAVLQVQNQKGE